MKMLRQSRLTQRPARRLILSSAILPAVLAASAFGATWTGAIPLDTSSVPEDIHVAGNSTVTLSDTGGGLSITETIIFFEPATAAVTLTVDETVPDMTLRSLATVLSIANNKTITINGSADFAPGALSTGPTQGTATDTGIILQKNGGTGTLILDDPTNVLAGTILKVLDGRLAIVGDANPVSSLTTPIEIGSSGVQAPILQIGGSTVDTAFANNFNAKNSGTIDHLSTTTDSLSTATGVNYILNGKILTVNVAAGGLIINGAIARSTLAPTGEGGTLRKTGVDTTLTLTGNVNINKIDIAEGRVDVPGRLRTTTNPNFGPNTILSLTNQSTIQPNILPATLTIPVGGTLEGLPGAFVTTGGAQSTLSLTGGTLNLGVGTGAAPTPGLAANLYTTGWGAAQAAFGAPFNPTGTYATYVNYFNGIGAGTVTSTSAGGNIELSFDPSFGNTAMYQILAPTYTRTDDIVSRFKGKIIITTAGAYTFATDADDGSMLYIDGQTVVSNNASQAHIRRFGTVTLAPGLHDIDIGYYEGGGLNGIIVDYTGPDTADIQTVIPNSVLLPLGSAPTAFLNPISVSENSTINTGNGASAASLSLAVGKIVNVNGYQLDMGPLTLTGGAGTYTINANTQFAEVGARSVADGGAAVALVNNGAGALVLESGASPQLQNAASSVTTGALGVVLGGAGGSPTGNATVNLNGGSLILSSKGGDQSYSPVGLSFTNGGSISAADIFSGVPGTTATPIRTTLTTPLTLNNATTLNLTTRDNYILRVASIGGAGSVSIAGGVVETSGAVNLTGTGQLTINSAQVSTLAGASAGAVTVTSSTVTNTGALSSGTDVTVTKSNLTSSGLITAAGAMTVTESTVTANGGATAGAITVTDGDFINTGALTTGGGGISLGGSNDPSSLELRGGSISGGPIAVAGGNIHATAGVTTSTVGATFTSVSLSGLRARYISTGVPGRVYPAQTEAGILAIETLDLNTAEAVLTGPLSFLPYQAADATISAFFGGVAVEPTQFAIGFFGNFTAPVSGDYQFQVAQVDDDAGFWVDMDFDGVFELAGANGTELFSQIACCGDAAPGTATLEGGRSYKVGIAVEDGQGGSSLVGNFALPGEGLQVVDPSGFGQEGLWTYGVVNEVIVDDNAELRIPSINGSVNVLANGDLDLTAGNSTFDSLIIGDGGVVTLGSVAPAFAGAPVPEPGSIGLLLAGALGWFARRQRPQRC